jgi:hypothetical protein
MEKAQQLTSQSRDSLSCQAPFHEVEVKPEAGTATFLFYLPRLMQPMMLAVS